MSGCVSPSTESLGAPRTDGMMTSCPVTEEAPDDREHVHWDPWVEGRLEMGTGGGGGALGGC